MGSQWEAAVAAARCNLKAITRARELIAALDMQPHPEGGHFREIFRSAIQVQHAGPPARSRSSLTAIHFLLAAGADTVPVAVVPAGCWQAARPLGAYTLVGCSVGPGFDFADFELLTPGPERERLRRRFARVAEFD